MPKQLNIHFNGYAVEIYVYASNVEDASKLLCDAGNAVNALLGVEEPDSDEGEVVCTGHVATKAAAPVGFQANGQVIAAIGALIQKAVAAAPVGFQANGQVIAAIGALIQKAVAAAPAVIAEIQTLAPEIEALIALFGKTPSTAA